MNFRFTFIMLFIATGMFAQVQDFEGVEMPAPVDTFIVNGGDDNAFIVGDIYLPNTYSEESWGISWSGWAISNNTDVETPGSANQFSVISGSGAEGSANYIVSYAYSGTNMTIADGYAFTGLSINNSTYAYLSMQDGDSFAKKFGGETGNDPDYFVLTIKAYEDGLYLDSLDFYLADFRFEDNSQDYILDEWTEIVFSSPMTMADSLTFALNSSDVSSFGINQPASFCVDNIATELLLSNDDYAPLEGLKLVNTLVDNYLTIESDLNEVNYHLIDASGRVIRNGRLTNGSNGVEVADLSAGMYWIDVVQDGKRWTKNFVK